VGGPELPRDRTDDHVRDGAKRGGHSPGAHPVLASVATATAAALVAWWVIERGLGRPALGRAVAVGIVSHLVLDIATHAPDVALWPGSQCGPLGVGLYSGAPSVAFVVELVYGVLCWWIYRGSRALLWVVVAGNLADISFFFAAIPGPEQLLAGHPMFIVTLILAQIVAMLVLVGLFSSQPSARRNVRAQTAGQQVLRRAT
jgi:hypothetical protein